MRLSAAVFTAIDPYKRQQHYLMVDQMFPYRTDGLCGCGCGEKLIGRKRRWASKDCESEAVTLFRIHKGDPSIIRHLLFKQDQGACRRCGEITTDWEADHILEVHRGGGGCGMDNFQTLCKPCHKEKTKQIFI